MLTLACTVTIEASKDGVKFSCQGDIGNGSVTLRQHSNVDKPNESIEIELSEPVSLTFSLKYLVNFCKASALSNTVKICLSNEVPLLVEYALAGSSYLRFYLAPKVRDGISPGAETWLTGFFFRLVTRSDHGKGLGDEHDRRWPRPEIGFVHGYLEPKGILRSRQTHWRSAVLRSLGRLG